MIPIVCFVGRTNAGKTTLLQKVIAEFTARGYRLAAVKHDVHGFHLDYEGKDSWKLKEAGAIEVILSSPTKVGIVRDVEHEASLEEIRAQYVWEVDLIVVDGYKRDDHPKVEVSRAEISPDLICAADKNLIAVVSDHPVAASVPCFSLDGISRLVDFLEERFLRTPRTSQVRLKVDGRRIPLKGFVQKAIAGTIRGLVSSLRGGENPRTIVVEIEGEP